MTRKKNQQAASPKAQLHPRNKHRQSYDFDVLVKRSPDLSTHLFVNPYGRRTIDFAKPEAVKALNKALLYHFYDVKWWDLPEGYLCPPVPGRADYLHYAADLLAAVNESKIPKGKKIRVLDIGTGANCIYPLIGWKEYGWQWVGSDTEPDALKNARRIATSNERPEGWLEVRQQNRSDHIFQGVIRAEEVFDLVICNPPFHDSPAEARAERKRKWKNLGYKEKEADNKNFGGQTSELHYPGGEKAFVRKMIGESVSFREQCFWFTTLLSKKANLSYVYRQLEKAKPKAIRTIDMAQGQKTSRIVAWTFLNDRQQQAWVKLRW